MRSAYTEPLTRNARMPTRSFFHSTPASACALTSYCHQLVDHPCEEWPWLQAHAPWLEADAPPLGATACAPQRKVARLPVGLSHAKTLQYCT